MTKDLIVNIGGMDVSITGQKKTRICIGIPMGEYVHRSFFHTMLFRMEEWSQIFDIIPIIESVIPVDEARNRIAKAAIYSECDYIFFIDSDVIIQPGQLEKLVSHNKDAITGIYYMRVLPHYSLIRRKIADKLYTPIEPYGTELIKIDGAGFGCFLVKISVFDKIEYPWFQFKYYQREGVWGHLGEDLYFCEQLQNTNIDMYCDPTIQCTHIGTDVTVDIANKYRDLKSSIVDEIQRSKKELSEFTGLSIEQVSEKCFISTELVANQYRHDIIEANESPKKFYKENKTYIFDLTNWHIQQRRIFDTNIINEIKNKHPSAKKILDFGSGCGQNAIMLAEAGYDVSMTDFEGYTSDFAKFRAKKRGLDIKFYDIELPINDKFDIILAFDVLEHVPDTEFEKTIYLLKTLKQDDGKILTTTSFGTQGGLHPMCYETSPEKIKLIGTLNEQDNIIITNSEK